MKNAVVFKTDIEIDVEGNKCYYLNNKLHREDGPAIEWSNGDKEWWVNGKRHREDEPAVECADGNKEWWINGECICGEIK